MERALVKSRFSRCGSLVIDSFAVRLPVEMISGLRLVLVCLLSSNLVTAEDWRMLGRSPERNMVGEADNLPTNIGTGKLDEETGSVDPGTTKNVRWVAQLGSQCYTGPSVGFGRVYIGTNNVSPRDKAITEDRSALLCFDEQTGAFLWQFLEPRRPYQRVASWEYVPMVSIPAIEEDRVWVVTPRVK